MDYALPFWPRSTAKFTDQVLWYGIQLGPPPDTTFVLPAPFDVTAGDQIPANVDGTHNLPGDLNAVAYSFDLFASGDYTWSPYLDAYQVQKEPVIVTVTPGQFGNVSPTHLSVSGAAEDPSHETAKVTI